MKAHQMDHETAILASSDGLFINDRERQLRLAITKAGNWCPIVDTSHKDESHALLSSSKGVGYLLVRENGLWKLPMPNQLHSSYSIPNGHHRIDYLKRFGPTSEYLKKKEVSGTG
ncbi:hypothetical protein BJV82DRAFT_613913 [Fennellomyces sp. T-0311]|nr:hypothetical protein BJV82DRAFT_613913 [Fennellomyces sp. T-0311]